MTPTQAAHALLAADAAFDAATGFGETFAAYKARAKAIEAFHMAIDDYSDVSFELLVARMLTAGVVTEAQVMEMANGD